MNAVLKLSALIAILLPVAALADTPEQLATQADTAYAQRDYNAPGIKSAQLAADLYTQAAAAATDNAAKVKYLTGEARANFFVGTANSDKATKLNVHAKGLAAADQAAKLLGLADVAKAADSDLTKLKSTLTADQSLALCEALYERGINLGEWGQANGVMQSLSKWPELRHNMEIIETLGHVDIENYGAYRVLGRGYYKLPSLVGGDMTKAAKYLKTAVEKTLVPGTNYSKNGFNNIYYADVLHAQDNDTAAAAILNPFIKADPKLVDANQIPETRQNQKDAADDMNGW